MDTLSLLAGIIVAALLMPVAAPLFICGSMLVISVCLAPFGRLFKAVMGGGSDDTPA